MRRMISYILMSSAILLGIGASISPVVTTMNSDMAYSKGQTLVFRLSAKDSTYEGYDPSNNITGTIDADYEAVNDMADIMRGRLDTWGLSEYNVQTVGYNTIEVSVRPAISTTSVYNELTSYLTFSGGDLQIDASNTSYTNDEEPAYAHQEEWVSMFDGVTAKIEYITQSGVPSFPVVVIDYGTDKTDIEAFNNLVTYCQKHSKESTEDDSGNKTEAVTTSLILWANRQEGDSYDNSTTDTNMASRILINESCGVEGATSSNAVYYYSSDTDKDYPKLQLIPASEALSNGSYDSSKANLAYSAAACLANKINAEKLDYDVTYLYSTEISPTVESLMSYSDWHVSAAMSKTLIATLIVFVITAVILVLFDRLLALGIVSSAAAATFLTFLIFVNFGTQFNIAALLGLLVIFLLGCFGGLFYASRLKDELYKGRTLKKAHSEAAKKAFWPTLDASIITIIIGIFVFVFAGDLAAKFGTVMCIGGLMTALVNLVVFRIEGWLLANDNGTQSIFPKLYNVDAKKIPDMLKEEKQTYFGPYEKTDFTKSKKWITGIMSAVVLAGIGTMIAFNVLNGTVYNEPNSGANETVIYVESRSDQSDSNDNPYVNAITSLYDESSAGSGSLLRNIYLDDTPLCDYLAEDVSVSLSPQTVYNSDTKLTKYWFYYRIVLNEKIDLDKTDYNFTITSATDASQKVNKGTFEEAFNYGLYEYYGANEDSGTVLFSLNYVTQSRGVPYIGWMSLGIGVGIAVATLYMMFRYRPSRALTTGVLALTAAYASTAFFVFTRISVSPIVSLGSAAVAVLFFLLSIFTLSKEKEIIKESREKDKGALAFRTECLYQANSRSAGDVIVFSLLIAYAGICFFGIGPSAYSSVYLNLLMGVLFSVAMALALLAPGSALLAKLFSKIHFNRKPRKPKKVGHLEMNKKKSGEPEEAIFIGIND